MAAAPEPVERTPDPEPTPLPPEQPSRPAPAPTVTSDGEGPMQVDVGQGFDLDLLMREVGLDNFMSDYARWATSRGYPQPDDAGNLMLPQPYDQYDEETLQALADTGDMWAQQFLADKLARKRPADAIELYREAAVSGSVYAMSEMAQLYKRIANKNADTQFKGEKDALDQVYALRDAPGDPEVTAYAWAAVAERSGWDPMSGSVTAHVTGRNLTDEQIEEACELSRSLQADMGQVRSERSIELPAATPPPLIVGNGPQGSMGTRCAEDDPPPWDMSGCREVALNSGDQTNTIWVCNGE
ncbi:MAG: hypothetical protein AAFN78_06570 [Pseudomonadota bacterium]